MFDALFQFAKTQGVRDLEVYVEKSDSLKIGAFGGEIETFTRSNVQGLGIRLLKDGGVGYAYTENLNLAEQAVQEAIANAEFVEAPPEISIGDFPGVLPELALYDPQLGDVPVSDKIQLALAMERLLLAADSRIEKVPFAHYGETSQTVRVLNSHGLDRTFTGNMASIAVEALVQENGLHKEHYEVDASRRFALLSAEKIAKKTAEEALRKLGSRELKSGPYAVVLTDEVFASFIDVFCGVLSAKAVQEGKSLLKDRIGEVIASPLFTLADDATRADGFYSRPFDAEGCPSKPLALLSEGKLQSYLHNRQTANKAGTASTGHASRGSYKGVVGVSPSNLVVTPGQTPYDALLKGLSPGVLLTEITGLHAGANLISGDFSLQAQGVYYENGQAQYPVHLFTVSGNFFQLLKDIEALGNQAPFHPGSRTGAPAVRIKQLAFAGS